VSIELTANQLLVSRVAPAAIRAKYIRIILIAFILGLPVWWILGVSFLIPIGLTGALICVRPSAHSRFTLSDCILAGIVFVLVASAYLNGFLIAQEPLRFLAALYNAAIWACGLVLVQQIRSLFRQSDAGRRSILHAGYRAFWMLTVLSWGSFLLAYAIHHFDIIFPSFLGAAIGDHIPESAALIRQSTTMVFTRADWGLPGVPMPRIGIYGPYPNSTAAVTAALGTLAMLHLHAKGRGDGWRILALEGLIVATLVITLSRSILGGWLIGAVVANLIFGSPWRRMASCFALIAALLLPVVTDVANVGSYRQYSTDSRFDNYQRAVEETVRGNPVLGLGIKPREEISHIAVGSHSTFVSAFTKAGALGLGLVAAYLVVLPAFRWLMWAATVYRSEESSRIEMRILFTLQATIWLWLCFEDLDAPATAAILIFIGFACIENISRPARPQGPRAVNHA
jgi:hypothetical protein